MFASAYVVASSVCLIYRRFAASVVALGSYLWARPQKIKLFVGETPKD